MGFHEAATSSLGLLAAISISRESLARPLPRHLRPAPSAARPAPSRSLPALSRRPLPALVLPGAGCGGSCSARSWRSAGAAAGGREPRAGAPSMSRRRRPRAARGRAAARGRRGSDAGTDRGRQRQPRAPLGSSGGPSPRVVPAGGRRSGHGHRVGRCEAPRGVPGTPPRAGRRDPCASCTCRARGGRDEHGGSAPGGRRGHHWQVRCPGPGVGEGVGDPRSSGLRSWKFPFALVHSGSGVASHALAVWQGIGA